MRVHLGAPQGYRAHNAYVELLFICSFTSGPNAFLQCSFREVAEACISLIWPAMRKLDGKQMQAHASVVATQNLGIGVCR